MIYYLYAEKQKEKERIGACRGIYGNGIGLTEKMLDYLWARQSVSLNNIANVDTPGFKSQYITFEEELAKRLKNASSYKKRLNGQLHRRLRIHTHRCILLGTNQAAWTGIM